MWLENKKTGLKWFIANEDHAKRLLKSGDFEKVEVEEKKPQKKAPAKRDEA
ncbi:hypothetical protein P9850_02040 [Anoxybacillus rupiensis]|uniref:Uncharacterized protein n=1 Tax=Anoxybacteroides rupiense TaxID=311460 RepID=A0ABD5IRQ2_9BACL|nr:hypothetical protein [Anoxybacillus rupiensis]